MSIAQLNNIKIGYDEMGQGAAVVLLHGFPFNRSMWREQAEALSAKHRVIMPDLRGHGETDALTETATMEEMAQDVAGLMDELNVEQAVIGGLSMGGYVALAFARLFPQRVRAFVLADTRPQADTAEARRNREESAERALKEGMEVILGSLLPKLFASKTTVERPEIVARVRQMIMDTKPVGAAAALRGMAVRRDQTDLLPQIEAPTLIVVGSEDQLTPPKDSELMNSKIRNSRLERIEAAGHVSNIERPAEFNSVMAKFLDGIKQ